MTSNKAFVTEHYFTLTLMKPNGIHFSPLSIVIKLENTLMIIFANYTMPFQLILSGYLVFLFNDFQACNVDNFIMSIVTEISFW